jgi:hypothetical protein
MQIAVCVLCVLCCFGCSREPEPLKTTNGITVRLLRPCDSTQPGNDDYKHSSCEFGGLVPGTRLPYPTPYCKQSAVVMLGNEGLCGEHYLSMWKQGDPTLTEIRQHDHK